MPCNFSFYYVVNIRQRNRECFNLVDDVVEKDIDKSCSVPMFVVVMKSPILTFSSLQGIRCDYFYETQENPPSS